MKPRQIIILTIILGLLALGILLKSWHRAVIDGPASAQTLATAIADFDPAKVERILIAHGTQAVPVDLVREKGTWIVKSLWNAKADPVKVEALMQALASAQGEFRGSGEKLYPDFGIQDKDAFSIKFLAAGDTALADLRLGTKRASEEGYFIRRAGGPDIYLVALNMAELLGIHTDFDTTAPLSSVWADFRLCDIDPEKVTKLTVFHLKGNEKTLVLGLSREADPQDPARNIWKFLRKDMTSPVDPEKVLKFIATLMSVRFQKVVDPGGQGYGLEPPAWQLAVTEEVGSADGKKGSKKILLSAGPKAEKEDLYYVKTSTSTSIFSLKAGYFDDLNVDDTHFVKEVAPVAAPEKGLASEAGAGLLEEEGLAV